MWIFTFQLKEVFGFISNQVLYIFKADQLKCFEIFSYFGQYVIFPKITSPITSNKVVDVMQASLSLAFSGLVVFFC